MKLKARKKLVKIFKKFEERFDIIKLANYLSDVDIFLLKNIKLKIYH